MNLFKTPSKLKYPPLHAMCNLSRREIKKQNGTENPNRVLGLAKKLQAVGDNI